MILFDDAGQLLPDGRQVPPQRPGRDRLAIAASREPEMRRIQIRTQRRRTTSPELDLRPPSGRVLPY